MPEAPHAPPAHDALTPLGIAALLLAVVAGVTLALGHAGGTAKVVADQIRHGALVALGAAGVGWALTRGGRGAAVGGALLFADLAGRVVMFVVLAAQIRELLRPWFVFEAISVVGIALIAWDVALAGPRERRPRLALVGATVSLAGAIVVAAAAASAEPWRPMKVAELVLASGLAIAVVARRATPRPARPPLPPEATSQRVLERAVAGVRRYRTGLTTLMIAGIVSQLVLPALGPEDPMSLGREQTRDSILALGAMIGWALLVLGTARVRRLPAATGASGRLIAAHVVHVVIGVVIGVISVSTLISYVAPRVAQALSEVQLGWLLIWPVVVGQLLLFGGLDRVGAWIHAPEVSRHARRAMLWFTIGAIALFSSWFASKASHGLAVVFVLLFVFAVIAGLTLVYRTLAAFEEVMSKRLWVAPFGDDEPVPPQLSEEAP